MFPVTSKMVPPNKPNSMNFCTLLCVRSSIAIILMGKRELVALLNLSSWCLVMVEPLFLAMPQGRGLMLWLFVGPTGVYLLDFFCSGIQFNLLLSPYPCFISLLYLDLYVLGDDALIS